MYTRGTQPADDSKHGIPATWSINEGSRDRFIPQLGKGLKTTHLTILMNGSLIFGISMQKWSRYNRCTEEETDGMIVRYLHERVTTVIFSTEYEDSVPESRTRSLTKIETVRAHQNLLRQCIEHIPSDRKQRFLRYYVFTEGIHNLIGMV